MIFDQRLRLAEAQQVGGVNVPLTFSTNVINLSQVRNLGQGQPLYAHFYIDSEFLAAGNDNSNVYFQVAIGSSANLVSNAKVVGASDVFVCTKDSKVTGLPTGARIIVPIGGNIDWLREAYTDNKQTGGQLYLGAVYALSGGQLAADPKCRVTVDLCLDHQDAYGWNPDPSSAQSKVWGSIYPKSYTVI